MSLQVLLKVAVLILKFSEDFIVHTSSFDKRLRTCV